MRFSAAFTIALPILAAATVIPRDGNCNTGSTLCCNSVQNSSVTGLAQLAGLLGISLGSITGLIGVTCTPLSTLLGGKFCTSQPVCCSNNHFGGFLALGCSLPNLDL